MPFQVPIDEARKLFPDRKYRFLKALTASEQKAAFHVQDEQGTDLCLKIINPNFEPARVQREIKALLNVKHPNVVEFVEYTFTIHDNVSLHYIIEKFVAGNDLTDELGTPWDHARAAKFFAALLDGLGELRRGNLVHRDLKPSNIRVRPDGAPVIIDLGLARHLDLPNITKTIHGAAVGTPIYFAPEQFSGDRNLVDHRTDLFAVGMLLYYALVGRHPFWNSPTDNATFVDAICNSDDHFNDPGFVQLPSAWQMVAKKLLKRLKENRFNDAGQAATAIRKVGGLS